MCRYRSGIEENSYKREDSKKKEMKKEEQERRRRHNDYCLINLRVNDLWNLSKH